MTARARLVDSGMMEEARKNRMQSVILTRLKLTSLIGKIGLQANEFHSLQDPAKTRMQDPANKSCSKRVTRVARTANQELPVPRIKSCPNRRSTVARTANQVLRFQHLSLISK